MRASLTYILICLCYGCAAQDVSADDIIGKWENVEHTLKIDIFKVGNDFKAKIIWFRDHDNENVPMQQRLDVRNPNKLLRTRKILGMEVLRNLKYNRKEHRWDHGLIYDATSGKEWSSSATLSHKDLLLVRGYWKFEWIGKTILFTRL